jgi:hypothetical protein
MKTGGGKRERLLSLIKRKSTRSVEETQGGLCANCSSLFSNTDSIQALLSPQGLVYMNWESIQASQQRGCSLCSLVIRHGSVPPHFRGTNYLRIYAVCKDEIDVDPRVDHSYPTKILSVIELFLWDSFSTTHSVSFIKLYTMTSK